MLCRGYLKPSKKMMTCLGLLLGEEVLNLFFGVYIDKKIPKIISANKYKPDELFLEIYNRIKEILEKGGTLKYE